MIYTVTLNPSFDVTLSVPKFQLGGMHRAQLIRQDPGGKGINVSRVLRALNISSQVIALLGGCTGMTVYKGLKASDYDIVSIPVEGETRRNITLFEEASGLYTKINEPGEAVNAGQVESLMVYVGQVCAPGDLWAFSGSLPPGASPDLYAKLIDLVQARRGKAFLDSSGQEFKAGLQSHPFAVKPNRDEAAELLQIPLKDDADYCLAVQRLRDAGVEVVALSLGSQGMILSAGKELMMTIPPSVSVRSPVGAGDAALAGLLWGVMDGCPPAQTAARAVACGTATAMQEGTAVGDRALVEDILERVKVVPLVKSA